MIMQSWLCASHTICHTKYCFQMLAIHVKLLGGKRKLLIVYMHAWKLVKTRILVIFMKKKIYGNDI